MSQEATPSSTADWPVLTTTERRVLGVLVEKAKTTPDAYPLSLNALVTGCNQKSNREPVLNLSDPEVEDTLVDLQKKGLTTRITGGRVERWRHNLYEQWHVEKVELAILAELLLRGPQTEGELRGRASRMEPIEDLDKLRSFLNRLKDRGLVSFLGPEGRRGTQVTHGFHDAQELERARDAGAASAAEEASAVVRGSDPVAPDWNVGLAEARTEITALRAQMSELQTALQNIQEQLRILKESLGE
jgi:uncharacterized protein YceH (UPF0502 family)